ncbi:hypothetical protein Cadr_000011812 [Camelus dromedarius]|uniref:Uncharacterized protein n=1 Tax=Camelus dromedarius TaxID=9838 RepID=A0A5N4DTS5_CAMDR|nr:hypothetical protein Cadr_000011812 [Camelus dromedarius]
MVEQEFRDVKEDVSWEEAGKAGVPVTTEDPHPKGPWSSRIRPRKEVSKVQKANIATWGPCSAPAGLITFADSSFQEVT